MGPFPQDPRAEHGFDNRGDHLSLSPFLLEAFFKLSRRIVQSPNFDGRTVGIWKEFFVAPPTAPAGDVKDAVRARLRKFMTRAFRRPVPEALLNRYTQHVHRQIDSGMGFTEAMKEAASAVLSSPRFLYLYNRPMAAGKTETLDNYDLASRLSFFLWGSIPDDDIAGACGQRRTGQVGSSRGAGEPHACQPEAQALLRQLPVAMAAARSHCVRRAG